MVDEELVIIGNVLFRFVVGVQKQNVPLSDIPASDPLPIVQFARMVKSDKCSVPGYDMDVAATLTRIIECAYESAATGKTVEF